MLEALGFACSERHAANFCEKLSMQNDGRAFRAGFSPRMHIFSTSQCMEGRRVFLRKQSHIVLSCFLPLEGNPGASCCALPSRYLICMYSRATCSAPALVLLSPHVLCTARSACTCMHARATYSACTIALLALYVVSCVLLCKCSVSAR